MKKRKPQFLSRPAWSREPEIVRFDPQVDETLLQSLAADIAAVMESGETYKRCRARWVSRIDLSSGPVVVKLFTERSVRHSLKQKFQRSRARRASDKAFRFTEMGFHTPRPLALLQEQIGPLRGNSCVVFEYVDGDLIGSKPWQKLEQVALAEGQDALDYVVDQVLQTRDRLIQNGLSHFDCHAGNFMFDRQGDLYLLDLDSIKPTRMTDRKRARMHQLFDRINKGIIRRNASEAA